MKTIGILGGMGSYATVDFFKRLVDAFPADKEWERPRILIDNNCIMPSRVRAILYNEKVEELISQMQSSVESLSNSGADIIVMGCMTAHHFYDNMPHQEKMINITKLVAKKIEGKQEVLILCTEGSMKAGVWDDALQGIKRVYPNEMQMKELREFIEIVKRGQVSEKHQRRFVEYVNELPCENVLLGCTELPVLLGEAVIAKMVYDPIQCAIDYIKKM